MIAHLRANLLLLVFTLLLCGVPYPLGLLGVGQVVLPGKADGSLIHGKGQTVTDPAKGVGSPLIAQPFTGDEYFQPPPSAAGYDGAASGASNWGANNYQL